MSTPKTWQKSSRSNDQSACVELANTLNEVRDSKNPVGPTLRANLHQLIHAARTGTLDR